MRINVPRTIFIILLVSILSAASFGQTTEFTYQGRLTDGTAAANGAYDFEFRLYDMESGGFEFGVVSRQNVPVINGIFTVRLDFGEVFTGASRFLQIAVKPAGGQGAPLVLNPRQPVTSTPQAIKSRYAEDAQKLGGVEANQFVQTGDSRLTDERNPLSGSANYIQNGTNPQTANFNVAGSGVIGGNLTVAGTTSFNTINAETQYNLGGSRILSGDQASGNLTLGLAAGGGTGANNTFVGVNSGAANTTGAGNVFLGYRAGFANTEGNGNAFVGVGSGESNTTGTANSFFGSVTGFFNTTGSQNSIFGYQAGLSNTTGADNTYFGALTGASNQTGSGNSFFGKGAGTINTAENNSFFGKESGFANTTGGANSFFGFQSGKTNSVGINNSFFGYRAGNLNSTGANNAFFGYRAGLNSTTGANNVFIGLNAGGSNLGGGNNTLVGASADLGAPNLNFATAIGAGAVVTLDNTIVLGRSSGADLVVVPGLFVPRNLPGGGSLEVCRAPLFEGGQLMFCSSSIRYKTDVENFTPGLDLVRRLRPVSYTWKSNGTRDVGFIAEEVAAIEPLLATRNEKGEIEGVKYDRISVALVNSVGEQQAQIEAQAEQIRRQQTQIENQQQQLRRQQEQLDALKKLFCAVNAKAEVCGQ
jgi:hypothetical protein